MASETSGKDFIKASFIFWSLHYRTFYENELWDWAGVIATYVYGHNHRLIPQFQYTSPPKSMT